MRSLSIILFFTILLITSGCLDQDTKISQIQQEVQAIDTYLNTSGISSTSLVWYDETGIRIVIQNFDNKTASPSTGQTINASVTGKLFSDQSIFFDDDIDGKFEDVLPEGLRYSLGKLLGGTSATFFIPSAYAYGAAGTSSVPSNSIIIYEATLHTVTKTSAQLSQFTADTTTIRDYLTDNSISTAITHESGLIYTIDESASGDIPTAYDNVTFAYSVKDMASDAVVIDSGTIDNYPLLSLGVDGLKIGIPLLEVGTKATFYIASLYGYGVTGYGDIDPNANLIFEIELIEIH